MDSESGKGGPGTVLVRIPGPQCIVIVPEDSTYTFVMTVN